MDGNQFDRIAKWMSTRRSRRDAVRAIAAGALGGAAVVAGIDGALAAKPVKPDCCPTTAPKLCELTCTDTISDPSNCGGCGITCTGGTTCQNGTCACPSGTTNCGGVCVNTNTSATNCGTCGHACTPGANQTASCSGGQCSYSCVSGYTLCGSVCVDTQSSSLNCGACGHACSGGAACVGGSCQATCNDNIKNGNETDVDCGGGICPPCTGGKACLGDNDCVAGLFCIDHICETCPAGQRACNNSCVNVSTDVSNCGACGVTCSIPNGTATCVAGACHVGACNFGFADCNNYPLDGCEVNVNSDQNNCGMCGNVCPSNTTCGNGICIPTCTSAANCPSTECAPATCTNGTCGAAFVPYGTPIAEQTAGDCKTAVCNGSGGVTYIVDDADVPDDGNICTNNVCTNGVPSNPAALIGTSCAAAFCDTNNTFHPPLTCDGIGNCSQSAIVQPCSPGTCTPDGCIA